MSNMEQWIDKDKYLTSARMENASQLNWAADDEKNGGHMCFSEFYITYKDRVEIIIKI